MIGHSDIIFIVIAPFRYSTANIYPEMHKVEGGKCAISYNALITWLYVCAGDNALSKARTYVGTIH